MNKAKSVTNPICAFLPTEVEGFDSLSELALDMRWSWNHAADEIWSRLDPALWDLTHNPWVVLQTVSADRLGNILADSEFRRKIDDLVDERRRLLSARAWFQRNHPQASLNCVAYFSMEFMLSEALPIYSGGLGNVAGDQLKSASDLGVPVIGISLLYQQGYFRQVIDQKGEQHALFPYNDPGQLPITPLRESNGEWLRLKIDLPGYPLWLRAWQAQVGRTKLYLLDSNDPANFPAHRGITGELYGGGPELRLMQEIVLGIAGWRLLVALGISPDVCHLNEGHAAFAVLERTRSFMEETGQSFEASLAATRAGNIFTTHTPVEAGFDRFAPQLIGKYFGGYAGDALGISLDNLLSLGRLNPSDSSEPFNMAYLALRGSLSVNGVSRLHGKVSRRIFQPLFARWPEAEVPVGHITNGVHMSSWDSEEADELWTGACGKERWMGTVETLEEKIRNVPDSVFWECRSSARASLTEYVRERLSRQLEVSGASHKEVEKARKIFDADTLTLGFARRFATYKRPNLLLHEPERLIRLLSSPEHPVQLIIAGKAHPADESGQAMIRQWMQFITRPEVHDHVVFLSDYDMLLTEQLVQGVDVWINTPRRPWEACGTSGMKVLVNAGLNLSELDGWWAEAYSPEVGWALGDGEEHGDAPDWDALEAETLYTMLEERVIPEFYTRDVSGVPVAWVARIRESMARLTPVFSSNRSVSEYTERYYLTAAKMYRERASGKGAAGAAIASWQHDLETNWPNLRFGDLRIEAEGENRTFAVRVYLNDMPPDAVKVELYADGSEGTGPFRQEMKRTRETTDAGKGYVYVATVSAARPAADYTPRIIPNHPGVAVPIESNKILWQR